jgi:RNA polymerase sigma-70 factor (ECF subfamily)
MYEAGRPVRPWLYTIATHQAIDALRRNKRHQRPSLDIEHDPGRFRAGNSLLDMVASTANDPHVDAERDERRALVRQAVDSLAEHLRVVVALSYYQGMKYKEIADILDIPVGTVKSRLHTAVHRLAEEWERMGLVHE